MKLRAKPSIRPLYAGPEIVIPLEHGEAICVGCVSKYR